MLCPFPELLEVPSGLLQVNFWAQPLPSTTGLLFLLLLSGGTAAGGGSSIQPSAKTRHNPLLLQRKIQRKIGEISATVSENIRFFENVSQIFYKKIQNVHEKSLP